MENSQSFLALVDSSFWIAVINENDSCHKQAQSILFEHGDFYEFAHTELILAETLTTLRAKKLDHICEKFLGLLDYLQVKIIETTQPPRKTIKSFGKNKKLSYFDCSLIITAQDIGAKIFSFDKNLLKVAHS